MERSQRLLDWDRFACQLLKRGQVLIRVEILTHPTVPSFELGLEITLVAMSVVEEIKYLGAFTYRTSLYDDNPSAVQRSVIPSLRPWQWSDDVCRIAEGWETTRPGWLEPKQFVSLLRGQPSMKMSLKIFEHLIRMEEFIPSSVTSTETTAFKAWKTTAPKLHGFIVEQRRAIASAVEAVAAL